MDIGRFPNDWLKIGRGEPQEALKPSHAKPRQTVALIVHEGADDFRSRLEFVDALNSPSRD